MLPRFVFASPVGLVSGRYRKNRMNTKRRNVFIYLSDMTALKIRFATNRRERHWEHQVNGKWKRECIFCLLHCEAVWNEHFCGPLIWRCGHCKSEKIYLQLLMLPLFAGVAKSSSSRLKTHTSSERLWSNNKAKQHLDKLKNDFSNCVPVWEPTHKANALILMQQSQWQNWCWCCWW